MPEKTRQQQDITIQSKGASLPGFLVMPPNAQSLVLFAHGSGSSRHSPRNRYVADVLNQAGIATLRFDLLTASEHEIDEHTRRLRFDIGLLTDRLIGAIDWTTQNDHTAPLRLGLFGASTGAAAALVAARDRAQHIGAVVSRGGRPDLAGTALPQVQAPTLLIVGELDTQVIALNEEAARAMSGATHQIAIVPGASHLFEELGTLERAAALARDWFQQHLTAR